MKRTHDEAMTHDAQDARQAGREEMREESDEDPISLKDLMMCQWRAQHAKGSKFAKTTGRPNKVLTKSEH
jgi:hypothetical protein